MRTLPTLLSVLAALPAAASEPVAVELGRSVKAVAEPAQAGPGQAGPRAPQSRHRDGEQGAVILELVVDPVTGRASTRRHHCSGHRFPAVAPRPTGDPRK